MNEVRRDQGTETAADEPLTRPEPVDSAEPAQTGADAVTEPRSEEDARADTENWIREQLAGRAAVSTVTAPSEPPAATEATSETAATTDSEPVVEPEPVRDVEPAAGSAEVEPSGVVDADSELESDGTEVAADVDEAKVEALPAYQRFDVTSSDPAVLAEAAEAARTAIENGECVVLPTDTVYGIGADAFDADAVQRLLDAKERGRDMPPPVLIGEPALIRALADEVPPLAGNLTEKHWPGPLTVIVTARDSLRMDLGETNGTVGLRVPDYELTRDLLRQTGPMAVSSANLSGRSAALTCDEAIEYFGNRVSVYLDGGPLPNPDGAPSSIVDFSQNEDGELLRLGALSLEVLRETCPDLVDLTAPPASDEASTDEASADATEAAADAEPGETDPVEAGGAERVADAESVADAEPAADVETRTDVPATSEDVERLIEEKAAAESEGTPAEPEVPEPEPLELKDPEPTNAELEDREPKPTDPVPADPDRRT